MSHLAVMMSGMSRTGDFEFRSLVDEFRCQPRASVATERELAVREQRRWRVRELAATRVMDEWGALDETTAARDDVSVRAVRETAECARALESLPEIAAVAPRVD